MAFVWTHHHHHHTADDGLVDPSPRRSVPPSARLFICSPCGNEGREEDGPLLLVARAKERRNVRKHNLLVGAPRTTDRQDRDHTDRVCMQYDGTPSLDIFATVPCYYKSKTISSIPTGASNFFLLIFFLLSPSFSKAVASLHTHGLHKGTCNIKQEGGEEVRKVGRGDVS